MKTPIRLITAIYGCTVSFAYAQMRAPVAGPEVDHRASRIQVLAAAQMGKEDAALLSSRQPAIVKAAEFNGYDLSSGTWIENQMLCPAAPNHLIMHYLKLGQDGGVSLFTAIVPRNQGQIRIIPVLYHSVQAFRDFGTSPAQRLLINQVIPRNDPSGQPISETDWSTLAFCYAALVGAEPNPVTGSFSDAGPPMLTMSADGKMREMKFGMIGSARLYEDWTIQFDRRSRLKSIQFKARPLAAMQTVPDSVSVPKMRPVPNKN
jgi:hypothetical protein